MNQFGWFFLVFFWSVLIVVTAMSYKILLSEPHIPMEPFEEEEDNIKYEE